MPKSPTSVYFLRESEKLFVARALADDNVDTKTSEHDRFWYEMRRVVVQPHVLLVSLSGFLAGTSPKLLLLSIDSMIHIDVTVSGLGVCVAHPWQSKAMSDRTLASYLASSRDLGSRAQGRSSWSSRPSPSAPRVSPHRHSFQIHSLTCLQSLSLHPWYPTDTAAEV